MKPIRGITNKIQEVLHVDSVSVKGDVVTMRRGFFHRNGKDTREVAGAWLTELNARGSTPGYFSADKTKVVVFSLEDCGDVHKPFRGGASVRNSTHRWATFTMVEV